MSDCSYTGDLQILPSESGDLDIKYVNGQACMTDGLDTAVTLSVLGESGWQNGLTNNPSEQYNSEFPEVVRRASVNDTTIKNGIQAIKKSLNWMIKEAIAQEITVTGEAVTVNMITWTINIIRGTLENIYTINWNKGILSIQSDQGAN